MIKTIKLSCTSALGNISQVMEPEEKRREDWASIQAYVSEMLKCHYLNTELSACICCCTTKYIIDVLMFSPLGLYLVCIANFTFCHHLYLKMGCFLTNYPII